MGYIILQRSPRSLPASVSAALALQITTNTLTDAIVSSTYSATVQATGGTAPYTWTLISAWPDSANWINFNTATGVISGVPLIDETENITVQVTDNVGATAVAFFTLTVDPASLSAPYKTQLSPLWPLLGWGAQHREPSAVVP